MTQPCLNLKIWQGFFAPKNMNMFLIGGCSILLRHSVDNHSLIYNCFCVSRNCLQYEPDHPIHIRTLSLVHSHVSESGSFDSLIATRFHLICFGTSLDLSVLQALWTDGVQLVLEQAARWTACSSGGERQVYQLDLIIPKLESCEVWIRHHCMGFHRVEEAVDVIAVYLQIHPDCKLASASGLKMMSGENLLRRFRENKLGFLT